MLNALIASTLFFAQWVCGAVCNDSTQTDTWFRHTVQLMPKPSSLHIAVACNVDFMVYVNERNISYAPMLRPGYYEFVIPADATAADIAVRTESQNITGVTPRIWLNAWSDSFSILADETWQTPVIPYTAAYISTTVNEPWNTPDKPQIRSLNSYVTYTDEGNIVTYDFGRSITGTIRLTLRGATKGEVICINGTPFIAKGTTDEQMSLPLSARQCGIAVIESAAGQTRKKISNIEAIEIW